MVGVILISHMPCSSAKNMVHTIILSTHLDLQRHNRKILSYIVYNQKYLISSSTSNLVCIYILVFVSLACY